MKYEVHYSGYYGYNIEVEAISKKDAEMKADELFDQVSAEELVFEPCQTEIREVR